MNTYDISLALNGQQIPATVNEYVEGEKTYYDISYQDQTLTIYKDTLYTWKADSNNGLSQSDIQTIGEQLQNF